MFYNEVSQSIIFKRYTGLTVQAIRPSEVRRAASFSEDCISFYLLGVQESPADAAGATLGYGSDDRIHSIRPA